MRGSSTNIIVRRHEIDGRSTKKVKLVEATTEYGETIVAEKNIFPEYGKHTATKKNYWAGQDILQSLSPK